MRLAGLIKDKKAATHKIRMENLKKYTSNVTDKRTVEDKNIINTRDMTSSMFLFEIIAGEEVKKNQKQINNPN